MFIIINSIAIMINIFIFFKNNEKLISEGKNKWNKSKRQVFQIYELKNIKVVLKILEIKIINKNSFNIQYLLYLIMNNNNIKDKNKKK